MKRILFALIVLMFLLAACGTPEAEPDVQVEEVKPASEVQEKVVEDKLKEIEEKIQEVEEKLEDVKEAKADKPEEEPQIVIKSGEDKEEEVETAVPPAPIPSQPKAVEGDVDEDILLLLNRADEKITSYKFTYAAPPQNLARDVWNLKGTRIKVELFDENWITHDEYFDTIYFDTAKKTAVGFCQHPKTARCADVDKEYDVDYEEAMIKTPYQWVKSIPLAGVEKVSTEMLWDRKVSVLRYMEGEKEYKQWVDNFAGLPVRVQEKEVGKDPVIWDFRYLSVNGISDSDLEIKRLGTED